jgi:hypothetical protein
VRNSRKVLPVSYHSHRTFYENWNRVYGDFHFVQLVVMQALDSEGALKLQMRKISDVLAFAVRRQSPYPTMKMLFD